MRAQRPADAAAVPEYRRWDEQQASRADVQKIVAGAIAAESARMSDVIARVIAHERDEVAVVAKEIAGDMNAADSKVATLTEKIAALEARLAEVERAAPPRLVGGKDVDAA